MLVTAVLRNMYVHVKTGHDNSFVQIKPVTENKEPKSKRMVKGSCSFGGCPCPCQTLLFSPDFLDLEEDGLEFEVSLKAEGHNSLMLHSPQRGLRGVQIVCPNPTWSYSGHKR